MRNGRDGWGAQRELDAGGGGGDYLERRVQIWENRGLTGVDSRKFKDAEVIGVDLAPIQPKS